MGYGSMGSRMSVYRSGIRQAAMINSSPTQGGSGARRGGARTTCSQTLSKQPKAGRRTAKSGYQRPTTLCSHLSLQ
eukprot:9907228-Heterocapsa_arctica.AAC.1